MRILKFMERNLDSTGWTIYGTTVGVISTLELKQIAVAALSAVVTYAAVHFTRLLLNKYAPLKKNGEQ